MKFRHVFVLAAIYLPALPVFSQDTFSICAVDTVTGEAGSAGASCIDGTLIAGGAVIISDIHNGVGVIHTQAYWLPANQVYANSLMAMGLFPQQIIDSLLVHDAGNDPTIRQYGIVKLNNGSAVTAAYTGANCFSYKNHITGPNYSIQGNILLGQQILDSMEARFLNTPGDLACKLMAAMQGAKVIGADTRCTNSGNSSLSSFLRVACPGDMQGNLSIDLVVAQGPAGFEPIDSLQTMFNAVHNCINPQLCSNGVNENRNKNELQVTIVPNPFTAAAVLRITGNRKNACRLDVFNSFGQPVLHEDVLRENEYTIGKGLLAPGIYFYRVSAAGGETVTGKLIAQ